ncbi:hypothetical protein KKG90_07665 [Candidatus Bipolaricaulota bacterium]|nr:hypothetical protein [Candidatus Bipolaricaulota bacterium]
MKRILILLCVGLLAIGLVSNAVPVDCGCQAPETAANGAGKNKKCEDTTEPQLPIVETQEAMEWQCIQWVECVEYDTRICDPCATWAFLSCAAACTIPSAFWAGFGCNVGCGILTLLVCGECDYCVEWELQESCGWVFTE